MEIRKKQVMDKASYARKKLRFIFKRNFNFLVAFALK